MRKIIKLSQISRLIICNNCLAGDSGRIPDFEKLGSAKGKPVDIWKLRTLMEENDNTAHLL
jgi:hypothetical protein